MDAQAPFIARPSYIFQSRRASPEGVMLFGILLCVDCATLSWYGEPRNLALRIDASY
jgi:hypothetical protein